MDPFHAYGGLNENVLLEAKQPKVSKLKHSCPHEANSGDSAHDLSGERGSSIQLHDCCLKLRLFFAWKTNFISSKSPHGEEGCSDHRLLSAHESTADLDNFGCCNLCGKIQDFTLHSLTCKVYARCALRWLLLVYILLQPGKEHLCILIKSATALFWYLCPPTRTPAVEPPPSPSPVGLAAMGTGAIRTNLGNTALPFLLALAMFVAESSCGTKAKVWPWMLTSSWAILMSDGAGCAAGGFGGWACRVAASGTALALGSCLIWTGWICRMTGTPEAPVPSDAAGGEPQSSCLISSTLRGELKSAAGGEPSVSDAHGVCLVSV
ncbi:hypothetical protein EYF80_049872 [Liparis tanakae]|uniref:Uncharacterized protein n=1 Tax=Liparis tanakae TaxID=230148 RepID=A0A4Z2FGD7_9TELE|nr:hypothetical protein EYF80_049872 [Liparis tanakae]